MPAHKVERIKVTCEGYRAYGKKEKDYAKRCPRETAFLPAQVKNWTRQDDNELQQCFIDLSQGVYRCRWCAGAIRMIRASEKLSRITWAKVHPDKNFPRIRYLSDLKQVQKELTAAQITNRGQKHFGPYEVSPAAAYARWWRRKKLPGHVRGLCGLCGNISLAYKDRPMKFHQQCLWIYQRDHGGDSVPRNKKGTFTAFLKQGNQRRRAPRLAVAAGKPNAAFCMGGTE